MKKWAYYNEFDLNAAEWLRQLIKLGAIMDGEVDERSISEVRADDVRGFVRVGFFAGIGGWDLALQRAGFPDDVPVWHGSCPCQAFSSAGKRKGFADRRDLWPVFMRLIADCRPQRVFGEQVAAAIGHGWLDRLHADLEAEGYACGHAVLGAHSAGAPHKRQRLYWMADAEGGGFGADRRTSRDGGHVSQRVAARGMGNAESNDQRRDSMSGVDREGVAAGGPGEPCWLGDATGCRREQGNTENETRTYHRANYWARAVPINCRDGKTRCVEPGIQPLVDVVRRNMGRGGDSRVPMPNDDVTVETANATAEARVMRLRGYGNAICVETAAMFVAAAKGLIGL